MSDRQTPATQVTRIMTEKSPPAILIPSALSPADAEECRTNALAILEAAVGADSGVAIDADGTALTPGAVQILVATTRTAERMGVALIPSDQCATVLSDLQLN